VLGASCATDAACKLWLADTFSGVPRTESGRDTVYRGGEHADTTVEHVRSLLSRCGIENYELLVGVFPRDTAARIDHVRFKLVHIDVDTYESAADVFHWAWPRMIDGSVAVFDDYGFRGCEGVTAFVNELDNPDQLVVHNLNGHAIVFKRPLLADRQTGVR
jgi:O-methyltransferase